MSENEALLPEIEGIEILDQPPEGWAAFTRVYYSDRRKELIETLTDLPVREGHVVAPKTGWPKRIYVKPKRRSSTAKH